MDKKKKNSIILWCCYVVLLGVAVVSVIFANDIQGFFAQFANPDNPTLNFFGANLIPNLMKTVVIVAISITLGIIIHFLAKITFKSKKGVTISKLIVNFLKWAIAITAIFFVMAAWGADTTMMLASAGVVTLIIGLGSQALVADILAGIFIVFEGDFQVGDIVIIDGWRGEVVSIGIRTTRLIDAGGNIKIVNNSEIKSIINQTKELSIAKCYVSIGYEARIENVESIIADNINKIKEKVPAIVEGPYYKGVSELGESGVVLLFVAKCKEDDIYQVQRDMNRQIKIIFDDNKVNIPFNQIVVHMGEDDKPQETVTKKTEKKVEGFNQEQKELSQDLEVKK